MGRGEDRFERMLSFLPEGWEAKAKELGALQRPRKIKTPGELLRLILLYLTDGKSFAGVSALARLSGEAEMSKVAVFKRMRNCAAWLRWMCENICRLAGLIVKKPAWLGNRNVIAVDGSEDVKCGVRRQCYMLHYSIDLFRLEVRELLVTDHREAGEKAANFKRFKKGDIVMGDRMYGNLPALMYLTGLGVDYVLRIQGRGVGGALYNGRKRQIDLMGGLSVLKNGETGEITARCLIGGRYVPVRVCALRKDKDSERKGLKRLRKNNQRKNGGKAVTKEQRENNKYIIVITSLGKEVSASRVLELYRARWQIEMAFKRLKSLFRYNDLPMKQSKSALAWFYGKLLLAALCETMVNAGRFSPPGERPQKGFDRT